jgi:Ca-activated chloride channel family protein
VRALLAAFAAARDLSDHFTLFAVGQAGGPVVTPEAFRNGPLSVALQRLLSAPEAPQAGMPQAVQQAIASVRGSDDPAAPLGSSEVVVVTARGLGAELQELLALAHGAAVDGVPLSVFGVGNAVDVGELSRLALAGQGNRRLLSSASEAAPAVDRELSTVARAVARAVRLRIRLAPGVRLVEVLGSKRLEQPEAEQVRVTENSIDQRLSRNLGIASDRGEDEEGIQVVIPTFYAGDSHIVLLDVVAAGPGPIVDVTVRYKDLAQLGNGIARERLALPNLELARGSLERNVIKNLLAYELSQELQQAGDAVAAGSSQEAARVLSAASTLLEQLDHELPGLNGDRELANDRELAGEYRGLLPALERPEQRSFVADSLHFASLLKLQPRPDWEGRVR